MRASESCDTAGSTTRAKQGAMAAKLPPEGLWRELQTMKVYSSFAMN